MFGWTLQAEDLSGFPQVFPVFPCSGCRGCTPSANLTTLHDRVLRSIVAFNPMAGTSPSSTMQRLEEDFHIVRRTAGGASVCHPGLVKGYKCPDLHGLVYPITLKKEASIPFHPLERPFVGLVRGIVRPNGPCWEPC